MARAFIKFLPADESLQKTEIHAAHMMSGDRVTLTVDHPYEKCQQALWDYNQGKHFIQVAFDFLTADERNFMQTGLTSEEWDALCPDEEEEPEEEEAF